MKKKRIAVVAGGYSSEREVSLRSGQAIYNSIKDLYDTTLVDLSKDGWRTSDGYEIDKNDFSYTDKTGMRKNFDFVIIAIHGNPGENGPLQGYFDLIGMPYSSCSREVSTITFNKYLTKCMVRGVKGIGLAKDIILHSTEKYDADEIIEKLSLPLFVKPNASGSSCGVTKVKTREELDTAIADAFKESSAVLLEEFIEGREFGQGIMEIDGKALIMPITELISSREFFDYVAKYTPGVTNEVTPADLSRQTTEKLGEISLEIYRTLGCEGIVRVDYIIKGNKPYFIEVNTVPGMTDGSIVPSQLRYMGIGMGDAWSMIIDQKKYNNE